MYLKTFTRQGLEPYAILTDEEGNERSSNKSIMHFDFDASIHIKDSLKAHFGKQEQILMILTIQVN